MPQVLVAGCTALLLALFLTPRVRDLAVAKGWVCHPRADRWSTRTVALMGGIAIAVAGLGGMLTLLPQIHLADDTGRRAGALVLASSLMFVVGIIDDRISIKPHTKLIAQVLTAALLVMAGLAFELPWRGFPWWGDALLTIGWVVAIGNALNLLDNMDGLCAGIAAIAALFLTIIFATDHAWLYAGLTAALAGSCLGYLRYNKHPAQIFMGDGGSLFIGCFLAGATILGAGTGAQRSVLSIIALPALVLLIPVLDTTLVTVARKWARRPITQGGRDHSSHRLVAIGLSEPKAVQLLYSLAFVGGLMALAVRYLDWTLSTILLPLLLLAVGAFGLYIGQVRVYEDGETLSDVLARTPLPLLAQHRYRRRIGEVLLDTVAIAVGYYVASVLKWDASLVTNQALQEAFKLALPVVIASHLVAYFIAGVYRGMWRYTSVGDLPRFAKATTLGLLISVAILHLHSGFEYQSKTLFAINWLVQVALLAGSRVSLKLIRDRLLALSDHQGRRVLTVGLGEGAEAMLRRLRQDRTLDLQPAGAICEDQAVVGLQVADTPVVGTSHDIERLLQTMDVSEVLLIDAAYAPEGWARIQTACDKAGIPARLLRSHLEVVEVELPVNGTAET